AMLAHDRDLRFFREGIFEPVGQPVRVAVAKHHDGGRGFRLFLRGWRRARIVDGRLAFLLTVGIVTPVIPAAAPAAPVIVVLLLALGAIAQTPELRLRRQQQRKRDPRGGGGDICAAYTGQTHDHLPRVRTATTVRTAPFWRGI